MARKRILIFSYNFLFLSESIMSDAPSGGNEDTIIDEYDVQAILAKYNSPVQCKANAHKVIELSDEDEGMENPSPPKKICEGVDIDMLLKDISEKYNFNTNSYTRTYSDQNQVPLLEENNDELAIESTISTTNAITKTKSAERKKIEKKQLKEEKQKERDRKKEETQRSKEIKKAIQMSNKQIRPEEAAKFITVNIDRDILNAPFASQITQAIQNLGSSWKSIAQIVPNSVTWTRKMQSHLISDDGKLTLASGIEDADEILLLMEYQKCLELTKNDSLVVHVQEILSMYTKESMRVTLGIYVVERARNKKECSKVSRKELEFALTELQLLCNCCHRFLESGEDVAAMIGQFTKSIAQAPYKLEKQEKYLQAEWYMSGDNKDCVRVDKDGNGLQRLWQQQLTSFPLARIETAEAIMSKYPTLNSLMEAYANCRSEKEQEQLLQDIPIRRAAGPITSVRKIGPELSRKMAVFYTSTSGASVV